MCTLQSSLYSKYARTYVMSHGDNHIRSLQDLQDPALKSKSGQFGTDARPFAVTKASFSLMSLIQPLQRPCVDSLPFHQNKHKFGIQEPSGVSLLPVVKLTFTTMTVWRIASKSVRT